MKRIYYLLPLVALIPLFLLRDFTPDNELRYLSIADEALRNGDIFTFTNHGVDYADKPPLYLWIVMLGKWLFGTHSMLFLGMFSILPALGILWIMNRWTKEALSKEERTSGALMLMTSVFFIGSAVVLRMDMLMCLFIVLSLYAFYQIYTGKDSLKQRMLFPVWVFLAVFTKGPVGILVPLLSTLVFLAVSGKFRTIGRYWGWLTWAVLVLLAGLWFCGVYLEGGKEYLNNLLFNQTVNRAVDSFHHKAPFWYYGVAIWYSLAPWALLMIGAIIAGVCCKNIRSTMTDLERLFLTIAATTFVMLSLISSKIQIYLLPAFPFIAYLTMLWVVRFRNRRWLNWLIAIPALVLTLALPALFIAARQIEFPLLTTAWVPVALAVLSIAGIMTLVLLIRGDLNRSIRILACGVLTTILVGSFAVPSFNAYVGYGELSQAALEASQEHHGAPIYSYKVRRVENSDVYLGQEPAQLTATDLADTTGRLAGSIILLRERDLQRDSVLIRFAESKEIRPIGPHALLIVEPRQPADSISISAAPQEME